MNAQRTSRRSSPLHLVTGPAAVALLLSAAPAEAGWKPPAPGSTAAAGAAAAGVGYSLRKNLGELIEQFGGVIGASIEEDAEAVYRLAAETDRFSGKLVGDSHPVLKGVFYSIHASRAAVAGVKEKLRSAQRKIGRLAGKAGETVLDARAALAINKNERRWYESQSGILDTRPLPEVRVRVPSSTPVSSAAAAPVQNDDIFPWRERGSNPVGEYALRCGGEYGISRYTVFYSHWKRLMEEHSGECPTDNSYDNEWNAVLNEGAEPDPWAPEQEELVVDSSPVGQESASHYQQDKSDDDETVPDYRAALDVLERQEAEAERRKQEQAAQEARRRTETLAKAQREEQKRLEYQRKAAERERRELQAQRERESERLASQRRSQSFQNSINQSIQMLNQSVQMLKDAREERRPRKSGCGTGYSQGRSRSCGEE